ncbi:MAG: CDP-glycerol glycerophosphotransferase family protein [Clostridiales bacterium]|nr:CDP-glycerol glycerophosphotransferase family protein [Clostridiales bacterium]
MTHMRLYIDPGTGSMLFAILIGLLGVARFAFKGLWVKLRFLFSGGKQKDTSDKAIPLAIFSDDKRYWSVFEPLLKELDSRGFDCVYMTASEDDPGLKQTNMEHVRTECIGPGNKAFAKLNFLKATIVLSTTPGVDVYQWKRSSDVKYYVHIPHSPAEMTTYRMFGIDFYDAVLCSGQFQIYDTRELEEVRHTKAKELVLVGSPFMDEKMRKFKERSAAAAEKKTSDSSDAGASAEKKPSTRTVLLAPSWGASGILSRFGAEFIRDLLATGYHIIVRPHPQSFTSEKELMDKLMAQFPDSEQLEWNRDPDNFDALNRSDILISDFSGVIFDFSLVFDKPVICAQTEFDTSPYDAWWLKRLPWGLSVVPRLGAKLTSENRKDLKEMIDDCLEDDSFRKSRHEVRNEAWAYQGEGARRMADYLISKYEDLTTEDVENEIP